MQSTRELLLKALWILVAIWCASWMIGSLIASAHGFTGRTSAILFGAAISLFAYVPMALLQYALLGYANPLRLFDFH